MCKQLINQIRAIESAKRESPRIVKVYETIRGRDDLVTILEVMTSTWLRIMDVEDDGTITHKDDAYFFNPDDLGNKRIVARICGLDPHDIALG